MAVDHLIFDRDKFYPKSKSLVFPKRIKVKENTHASLKDGAYIGNLIFDKDCWVDCIGWTGTKYVIGGTASSDSYHFEDAQDYAKNLMYWWIDPEDVTDQIGGVLRRLLSHVCRAVSRSERRLAWQ